MKGGFVFFASTLILIGAGMYCCTVVIPRAQAAELTPEQRSALQTQYDQIQKEIAEWQKVIDDTKAKGKSLQGDVTQLEAQIKKAQAEINKRTITINQLTSQINQKSQNIATLEERMQRGRDSLAKLIREKNQLETTPLVVVALSAETLSEFFADSDSIDSVNSGLQSLFDELQGVKTKTVAEKEALAKQQDAQLDAQHETQLLKKTIDNSKQQKAAELTLTKGQESAYNKVLAQKQAQATALRNALFNLRDAKGITFETALQYATAAEKSTGVRAAFILGILRQESNLGTNVGQCYLTDSATGAGKGKNTGTPMAKVMNPTRDVPPFIDLMGRLGLDPYNQVVSCPQSIGWGGAMGPSQFIASTWKIYEDRIERATGNGVANPWDAQDAVMATALYMADLGASAQTYSAERKAAGKYYAGSNWQSSGALKYAGSVLSYATQYQENIDFLKDF